MNKTEIIAEVACIHEGEKDYIFKLIPLIKESGATAVKFQCFDPEEVVSKEHPDYDYLKKISFNQEEWHEIISFSFDLGLHTYIDYSGNFSLQLINNLKKYLFGIKINSSEMQNKFALEKIKDFENPLLVSCSGSNLLEIIDVLELFSNNRNITLMHGYQSFPKDFNKIGGPPVSPLKFNELDLQKIKELKNTFPQYRIGICDHLDGSSKDAIDIPSYAIVAGANVIEKHVTLNREDKREDYFSALEPSEFFAMVKKIKYAEDILGSKNITISLKEKKYIEEMKKSLFANQEIKKNQKIYEKNTILKRDGKFKSSINIFRSLNKKLNINKIPNTFITNSDLKNKIGIFCNSRLSSNRLKNKALLSFYKGMTTLGYLLNRLNSYEGNIGHLALATTSSTEDDKLVEIASKMKIDYFRGSTEDVMGRMVKCAEHFKWDTIVRVTGDDQFISCEHIEEALRYHLANNYEFTRIEGLPVGMACEIIEYKTVKQIHRFINDRSQTEHLTWFLDNDWICKNGILKLDLDNRLRKFRVTLDYEEDYVLMKSIANECHSKYGDQYLKSNHIFNELININPKWTHDEKLWTIRREDIDTSITYLK